MVDSQNDIQVFDGGCNSEISSSVFEPSKLPGDKSISHRALIMSALADGTCSIDSISTGQDVFGTANALRQLGAIVDFDELNRTVRVQGVGADIGKSVGPEVTIDCGNSGTSARLLMGLVSAIDGLRTTFVGDNSLSRRPMSRIAEPLRSLGASTDNKSGDDFLPMTFVGSSLKRVDVVTAHPSAQIKSALMLAGLVSNSGDDVVVGERTPTRMHTEEMLAGFGVEITPWAKGDVTGTRFKSQLPLTSTDLSIPADPSQLTFWAVAALIRGFELRIDNAYLREDRLTALTLLKSIGADISFGQPFDTPCGPCGSVVVRGSTNAIGSLNQLCVDKAHAAGLIDEVPILAVCAALIPGTHRFSDVGELRIKESDRIETTAKLIRELGREVNVGDDWLEVLGSSEALPSCKIDCDGDHRIAMSAAIASFASSGQISVSGWSCVDTSYPGFLEDWTNARDCN